MLGGGIQEFLPTSGGRVVACCYRPEKNKLAKDTLLVGGRRRHRNAELFAKQKTAIPFFKFVGNGWEYIGDFRVARATRDAQTIAKEKIRGEDDDVRIVLYLEAASDHAWAVSAAPNLDVRLAPPPARATLEPIESTSTAPTLQTETKGPGRVARQPDVEKRLQVERAAIQHVLAHYSDYELRDRQLEYVGWDFEATKDGQTLFLEVKGTSAQSLQVELTPNEYAKMRQNPSQYRVCVVVDALSDNRILHCLRYVPAKASLVSESGLSVGLQEVPSARLFQL